MYDLILLDFSMPVCGGAETTKRIKKLFKDSAPGVKQPFICCLTSYNSFNFKLEAYVAGMDAFLTKPIFKSGVKRLLAKVGIKNK